MEDIAARWGIARWFNVLVMSWIAVIPQTVIALAYASEGLYRAAHIDSMASTLIDAFLVAPVVGARLAEVGRALAPTAAAVAAMSITTLYAPAMPPAAATATAAFWFLVGAVLLPLALVWGEWERPRVEPRDVPLFLLQLIAMVGASAAIADALLELKHLMGESALGVLGAAIGTSPDFAIAAILALAGRPGGEIVETMVAAAIHDQLSDPALVLLIGGPDAAAAYPHALAATVAAMLVLARYWPREKPLAALALAVLAASAAGAL